MKKLLFLLCLATLASCSDDNGGFQSAKSRNIAVGTVTDDTWTYISLTTGKVVGTSPFISASDDSLWAARTDWDIALCGSRLRTNGGTSGTGLGGAIKVNGTDYESITEPAAQDFTPDSIYSVTVIE